jgi:hypothetical protein
MKLLLASDYHPRRCSQRVAYYFDHAREIQQEVQADREYADKFFCQNPSLVEARLKQERLKEAS